MRGGLFKPGQSGNPGGRPIGARNKVRGQVLKLMDEKLIAVLRTVALLAETGDMNAARLFLGVAEPLMRQMPRAPTSAKPVPQSTSPSKGKGAT